MSCLLGVPQACSGIHAAIRAVLIEDERECGRMRLVDVAVLKFVFLAATVSSYSEYDFMRLHMQARQGSGSGSGVFPGL